MYDRAPRVLSRPFGSTAPGVGPGTYNLADKRPKESYAPFSSMGVRESFLTVNENFAAAPGPGHYTPMFAYDTIKGGGSLNNKADRFYSPSSKVPGPGAYTVAKPSDWIRKTYPLPKNRAGPHRESVKVGHMTFHRQPTAPSIPMPGQNYGYDEDPIGNLRPQILPPRDMTMGPAYYNVSQGVTSTTKKYKGVHFGHLKAQRTQFKGSEGPGPGDYDPHMDDTRDGDEGSRHHTQNQSGYLSNLPRYHELVTRIEMKRAVPGPGQYEIKSQFSRSQSPDDEDPDASENVAPFGSRLQRFLTPKHASPSCTTYQLPHTKGSGSGRAPFGQSSTRFKPNRLTKQLPGPGAYNNEQMTSLATELTKKAMLQGIQKYPFGTTSVRTAPLTKKDELYMPGPAHYQQDMIEGADETADIGVARSSTKPHGHSPRLSYTFASTSKRLYSPPRIVTDIPPPGSYEISESFSKTQGKAEQSLGVAQTAFLSTAGRFAPPRDILLEEPDALNPGPGEYDSTTLLGKGKQGLLCSKDERFKGVKSTVPGPGSYEMSRTQKDTLLQGTFNASLTNPLSDEGSNVKTSVSQKRPKFVLGV